MHPWSVALALATGTIAVAQAGPLKPLNNVLVILADDLGAFHLAPAHPVQLPGVNALRQRGVTFANAHTNFPVCGPSRQSLMTGRLADSLQVWTFDQWFMQQRSNTIESLGKHVIRKFNAEVRAFGKIFHDDGHVYRMWFYEGDFSHKNADVSPSDTRECNDNLACAKGPDHLIDAQIATDVASWLSQRKTNDPQQPFLGLVGFRRPHIAWASTPEFDSKYTGKDLDGMPDISMPPALEGNGTTAIPGDRALSYFKCVHEIKRLRFKGKAVDPVEQYLRKPSRLMGLRQKYYGSARWMDSRLQVVLAALDQSAYANNTAIVFTSDHGFALGEHGLFCKNALFDQQTRVPLVVVPARHSSTAVVRAGETIMDPVSLVDVFPTVLDLMQGSAQTPRAATVDASPLPLDGKSLYPALWSSSSPSPAAAVYAFSQYPRCELVSGRKSCVVSLGKHCDRSKITYMGYAVRTRTAKYVEWRPFREVRSSACGPVAWPGMARYTRQAGEDLRVPVLDMDQTGTEWSKDAVQRELYLGYSDDPETWKWGAWETENALVTRRGEANVVQLANELSASIRWRFDNSFHPDGRGGREPCGGLGEVRLRAPALDLELGGVRRRSDVGCVCAKGGGGVREDCGA